VKVDLWMTQWGAPLANGSIKVVYDESQLRGCKESGQMLAHLRMLSNSST
jgi:hypothetical protein